MRLACGRGSISIVVVIGLFMVLGCRPEQVPQDSDSSTLTGGTSVGLEELWNPTAQGYLLSGDRIYTIDSKRKQVLVFSDTGALIQEIGRDGRGPGEFTSPSHLDVLNNLLVVSEKTGRVSIFDTTGTYSHSFYAAGVNHVGGNLKLLTDSLLVITGRRPGDEPYTGTMAHIYSVQGILVKDFLMLSDKSRKYESRSMTYAHCDKAVGDDTIWCAQSMEYVLYQFDYRGMLLDSIALAPSHYRPLTTKEPKDKRSDRHVAWWESWDWVNNVVVIDDRRVAVMLVGSGGGPKYDIVDVKHGSVLKSYRFAWGSQQIVDVDHQESQMLLRSARRDDGITAVEVLPVAAID